MALPARTTRARYLLSQADWPLVGTTVLLAALGAVMIYSATRMGVVGAPMHYLRRQAVALAIGAVALAICVAIDYRTIVRLGWAAYAFSTALLVFVLILGRRVAGTQGWIDLGPLSLQPSEVAKLALVLALADHLGRHRTPETWRDLAVPVLATAFMIALVLAQPDLGTAVVFGIILLGMLYIAQTPARHLAWMTAAAGVVVGVAVALTYFGWVELLQPHQMQRLTVFLDPAAHGQGAGWNVVQSVIAIGSGQLMGRGLFAGPQTQLAFVPARHTDFIFSVVGEELGFFGAAAVLGLYLLMFRRMAAIAAGARDRAGTLLATGVVTMVAFHALFNVAMTVGLVPVMGLPLPLLSSGGSHASVTLAAVGLVIGVGARRVPW